VLFVSTIEVRKNHQLAFRIWSRLLRELPRERVPTLVFAGSVGWMVDDLLKAIDNTNALDGKLVLIHKADDATLRSLYEACRFTLFPSLYEGWGLPVSDSLAFGKVCVASNTTSIPEAGGDFCVYIDPENTTAAYEIIRELIESPTRLRDMERRLKAQFRPTPWSATARAIIDAMS
jgi:glycosyltransferase involved in cell wall biosynthesis